MKTEISNAKAQSREDEGFLRLLIRNSESKVQNPKPEIRNPKSKMAYFDSVAAERDRWKRRNWYYNQDLENFIAFTIPPDARVLEIGCGAGDLLAATLPSFGVGVDFSRKMLEIASAKYPHLKFAAGDAEDLPFRADFDYIIISDLMGHLDDVWQAFHELRLVTGPHTKIVITYYNYLWEPVLLLAEKLRLKMPQRYQNWLSEPDIANFLYLAGYEVVKAGSRFLCPRSVPLFSSMMNRFIAKLPLVRKLGLVKYVVAKQDHTVATCLRATQRQAGSLPVAKGDAQTIPMSCSVIVPCRNEAGNIEPGVERIPEMGDHTEIIFVDGNSTDGTVEKIEEMIEKYRGKKDIKLIHQIPRDSRDDELKDDLERAPNKMLKLGKGDAVRKGFDAASGDILMILDSDLTVPPEDLPKFYAAIADGRGELINGTRLVYQMDEGAMRLLNIMGNKFFSLVFTWLLEQRIKDTLCGTKVLLKRDYIKIRDGRDFFGDFDPFGDFDLLFGAAKLNLKIVELPVRYRARTYGDIKIERFKHGLILLKMSSLAFTKLKLS